MTSQLSSWFFAGRLAFRQLKYAKMKTATALLGVMFACVLVFMQMGFRDSLFASASILPRALKGDLFVLHTLSEALWRSLSFSKHDLARLYAHPAVDHVACVSLLPTQWKNPETLKKTMIQVIGCDPYWPIFQPRCGAMQSLLSQKDTVLFDRASKPEFGPIVQRLKEGSLDVEMNNRKITVCGLFHLGVSFATSGTVLTSESTFEKIFPSRLPNHLELGILTLDSQALPSKVKEEMKAFLSPALQIFTRDELIQYEEAYWRRRTAIGFIFGLGMIIGLVVGMVIVYQILFTDVLNHLSEYATLRAMGYPQSYLVKVVISAALWLALLGFLPGLLGAFALYGLTESITLLPMPLTLSKIMTVWGMIFIMCSLSGGLAVQKLKSAQPADLF